MKLLAVGSMRAEQALCSSSTVAHGWRRSLTVEEVAHDEKLHLMQGRRRKFGPSPKKHSKIKVQIGKGSSRVQLERGNGKVGRPGVQEVTEQIKHCTKQVTDGKPGKVYYQAVEIGQR
jgi:hypothetical protein